MLNDYLAKRQEIITSARQAAGLDTKQGVGTISWVDSEAFQRVALTQIHDNWYELTKISLHKMYRFWFEIYHLNNRWAKTYIFLMQMVLLSFSFWGGVVAWRNKMDTFPNNNDYCLLYPVTFCELFYIKILCTTDPTCFCICRCWFFAMLDRFKSELPATLSEP